MRWSDLNLFATEHLVLSTPLSAEECQARLKARLRPRYWFRVPSTETYPVFGRVSPDGFSVARSQRNRFGFSVGADRQFNASGGGVDIAGGIRIRRFDAVVWSLWSV